jgi:hypothetical protein
MMKMIIIIKLKINIILQTTKYINSKTPVDDYKIKQIK